MSPTRTPLLLALAIAACLVAPAAGQISIYPCPANGDDGFDIGCCRPAPAADIPDFGQTGATATYGCLRDCSLEREFDQRVKFEYERSGCDTAKIGVSVAAGVIGAPDMRGTLYAKYSRTYYEIPASGGPAIQVWRFLVNGDFYYGNLTLPSPCPTPREALSGAPVHFHGSIDFRCDPSTRTRYDVRFDLSHLPDCVSHASWSTRPLPASNTTRSYHLVGPAPFIWAGAVAPTGSLAAEKVRSTRVSWSPYAEQCLGEQDMVGARIRDHGVTCLNCGTLPVIVPGNYHDQELEGRVTCGGMSTSFRTRPLSGATRGGLLTLALGYYRDGTQLNVHFGLMEYTDMCTGEGARHLFAGSSTVYRGSIRLFSNTPSPVPSMAMDLSNSLVADTWPPSIGWGSPYYSTIVWQLNQ